MVVSKLCESVSKGQGCVLSPGHEMPHRYGTDLLDSVPEKTEHDPVNHPTHYTTHPSGIECIQITRWMSFNLGNAVKYIWRNGIKPGNDAVQDLEKAVFYLQDEIARIKKMRAKNE
jgi:hypothetical protein